MSDAVSGIEELRRKLESLGASANKMVSAALYQEATVIKEAAVQRCPKDKGILRNSHGVTLPKGAGLETSVTIFAGGGPAPYGIYVHENLTARHPIGEAKWLERTVHAAAQDLAERVSRRIDLNRVVR